MEVAPALHTCSLMSLEWLCTTWTLGVARKECCALPWGTHRLTVMCVCGGYTGRSGLWRSGVHRDTKAQEGIHGGGAWVAAHLSPPRLRAWLGCGGWGGAEVLTAVSQQVGLGSAP